MPRKKAEKAVEVQPEVVEAGRIYTVFYRELTATGRNGAVSSKVFTSKKDADEFAEKVEGRVK